MSEKTLYYAQLAEDTARRLTGSWNGGLVFCLPQHGSINIPTPTSS